MSQVYLGAVLKLPKRSLETAFNSVNKVFPQPTADSRAKAGSEAKNQRQHKILRKSVQQSVDDLARGPYEFLAALISPRKGTPVDAVL